jgi:hypothetical protein
MITHVAIQYGGKTYSLPRPKRHHHIVCMIVAEHGLGLNGPDTQGFLDHTNTFLNRQTAYIHATECNQIVRKVDPALYNGDELYSEDLW